MAKALERRIEMVLTALVKLVVAVTALQDVARAGQPPLREQRSECSATGGETDLQLLGRRRIDDGLRIARRLHVRDAGRVDQLLPAPLEDARRGERAAKASERRRPRPRERTGARHAEPSENLEAHGDG